VILHDTWRQGSFATLRSRLGWAGWLAALLALAFSGLCAMAWTNSDQTVVWLLSRGVVGEAETHSSLMTMRYGVMGAGIAGLVATVLIAMRGVLGINPWTPVQALSGYLMNALRPVFSPIRHTLYAASQNIGALAASLFLPVLMRGSPVIRGIWTGICTTIIHTKRGIAFSQGCLRTVLSASIRHMGNMLALALRRGWAVISIPLSQASRMVAATGRHLQQLVSTVVQFVGLLLSLAANLVALALTRFIAVLAYQWRAVSAMAIIVKSTGEHLGHAATAIFAYLGRIRGLAMRRGWAVVSFPLAQASRMVAATSRHAQRVVSIVVRFVGVLFSIAANLVALTLGRFIAVLASQWRLVSAMAIMVCSVGEYLGNAVTAILAYLGRILGLAMRRGWCSSGRWGIPKETFRHAR